MSPLQKYKAPWRLVFTYAKWSGVIALIYGVCFGMISPLFIWITKLFIQELIILIHTGLNEQILIVYGVLGCLLLFAGSLSNYFNTLIRIKAKRKLSRSLTRQILNKVKNLPYSSFEDSGIQDVIHRVGTHVEESIWESYESCVQVISVFVGIIGISVIFISVSPFLAAATLISAGFLVWSNMKDLSLSASLAQQESLDERRLKDLATKLHQPKNLFEIIVFQAFPFFFARWNTLAHKVFKQRVKTNKTIEFFVLLSVVCSLVWISILASILTSSFIHGVIDIALYIACFSAINALLDGSTELGSALSQISKKIIPALAVDELMSFDQAENISKSGNHVISPLDNFRNGQGQAVLVEFCNVSFRYPNMNTYVLQDVSFSFSSDENIALVGENGAGKSTLIKLLLGLYSPTKGKILMNGVSLDAIDPEIRTKLFSAVFQDYAKYQESLRENVGMGHLPSMQNDTDIEEALNMGLATGIAELDQLLGRLKKGGKELSEGQWQRIAIARGCIGKTPFLVLDEPTASLDPIAESELYEIFYKQLSRKGICMISHRLGSAKLCDRILLLRDGGIYEEGSHEVLMNRKGLYYNWFEQQRNWYYG